ncbi:hypothetical protein AN958_06551 [Leucoagaricus sp. SymC.cos]|nr:hypothetical protein AN958_06551 [Leucoagaricus sp. SymC.cos]
MDAFHHTHRSRTQSHIFQPLQPPPPARHLGEDVRKPPKYAGRFALFLWRLQLWFECTFGLTVMEPWERMVVLTLFAAVSLLVCTGLVRYFPEKISGLQRRTMYYLWGHADEIPFHLHSPQTLP